MQTYIECFCENKFNKKQMLSSHFFECPKIQDKFKDLDNKISRAIKKFVDSLDKSNEKKYNNGLFLLKLFLKKYLNLVEEIINKNKKENVLTDNFFRDGVKLKKEEEEEEEKKGKGEIILTLQISLDHHEKIKANLNELFCDVFQRCKEKFRLQELKYYTFFAEKKDDLIEVDKTLLENKIQDDEYIQFIINDEENKEKEQLEEEKEEENEEEKIEQVMLFEAWTKEYKDEMEKNLNSGMGPIHFLIEKYKEIGMKIKEHEHKLIYCKTNLDWTCSNCSLKSSKEEPRLYCSICDYNMCNYCRKNKNYYKIGNIPLSALPSDKKIKNYVINYREHKHRLVYCRTKRTSNNISVWNCDKCKKSFNEKKWTFYCTKCDFDLCANCALKENI